MNLKKKLTTGWHEYFKDSYWCLIVLGAAAVFDGITTSLAINHYGVSGEVHLAIRVVCYVFGPVLGVIIGKLCQIAAFILITKIFKNWLKLLCILATAGYIIAGILNVRLLLN